MTKQPTHLRLGFLCSLLNLCSLVLLRDGVLIYCVVIGKDSIQFI